jgi:hypothetical protein
VSLWDTRASGDRSPFEAVVDLGEGVNLAAATVKYTLWSLDFSTKKIVDQVATPEDITDEGAGQPALSRWLLSYEPTLAEVTVEEAQDFVGRFTVTYAGGKDRHYPKGDFQRVSINP